MVVGSSVLVYSNIYTNIPFILGFFLPFHYLIGPLFYFYISALTKPDFKIKKRDILHFAPFFICVASWLPFFIFDTPAKLSIAEGFLNHNLKNSEFTVRFCLRWIHILIYLCFSCAILIKHKKRIKDQHSAINKIKLTWLRNLLIIFTLVLILSAVFYFTWNLRNNVFAFTRILIFIEPFFVFYLGYKGLTQPYILINEQEAINKKKYSYSNLTKNEASKSLNRLLLYLKSEKPFIDPNLTLKDLARKTNIQQRYLSQIINEYMHQNFHDFINHYRIEFASQMLCLEKDKSILDIAYDSGFNSKSSFNTEFKKNMHMTPSQYRKRI
jgi:AraC-like DNA-binding protein